MQKGKNLRKFYPGGTKFIWNDTIVSTYLTKRRQGPTGEQYDPFQFLVEKEIVEAPQRTVLPKRIRGEVRVIGVDVAVDQVDFLVERDPKFVVYVAEEGAGGHAQKVVHVARNKLERLENIIIMVYLGTYFTQTVFASRIEHTTSPYFHIHKRRNEKPKKNGVCFFYS